MAGQAQRVIEEFWRIQDAGDYTKLAPLFAEDAFLEDPIWGQYRGRAAILGFMTTMVEEMAGRKVHFTVDEICGDDHAVWARWTMHMEGAPSPPTSPSASARAAPRAKPRLGGQAGPAR